MSTALAIDLPTNQELALAAPWPAVKILSFEKGREAAHQRHFLAWQRYVFGLFEFLAGTPDCGSFVADEAGAAPQTWALLARVAQRSVVPDQSEQRRYLAQFDGLSDVPRFGEVYRRELALPGLIAGVPVLKDPKRLSVAQVEGMRRLIGPFGVPRVLGRGVHGVGTMMVCRWLLLLPEVRKRWASEVPGVVQAWAEAQIDFFALLDALKFSDAAAYIPADRRRDLADDLAQKATFAVRARQRHEAHLAAGSPPPSLLDLDE